MLVPVVMSTNRPLLAEGKYSFYILSTRYIVAVRAYVNGIMDGDILFSEKEDEYGRECYFTGIDVCNGLQAKTLRIQYESPGSV